MLVEDNDLHENRENGADIKTCTRVTLRGNRIWGHRRSSTSGGEGVVVHMSARDVTLEDNDVRDNGRGIQIGGVRQGAPPTHIVLRRNRVFDGVNSDGSEGSGIRIDTAIDVKVVHNTVWNMPTYGLVVGKGESGASEDVEVRNNILGGCAALAVRVGTDWEGLSFDGNLYSPLGDAPTFRKDSRDQELSTGRRARAGTPTPWRRLRDSWMPRRGTSGWRPPRPPVTPAWRWARTGAAGLRTWARGSRTAPEP
ncbi:right-handed parallel beta-helix repeat-containing protein [Cystobacter fuscus]